MSRLRVGRINQSAMRKLAEQAEALPQLERVADEIASQAAQRAHVRTGAMRRSLRRAKVGSETRVGWDVNIAPYGPIVEAKYAPHLRPAAEAIKQR
jgi:hypothetical protein